MESNGRTLSTIRRELTSARIALRNLADELARVKAEAEQRAIAQAGGEKALGGNAEARERALAIALSLDGDYQAVVKRNKALLEVADYLECDLEDAKDARREAEWRVRLRLAEALEARDVQSDHEHARAEDDVAFDDAALDESVRRTEFVGQGLVPRGAIHSVDPKGVPDEPDYFDRTVAECDAELAASRAAREAEEVAQAASELQPEDPGYWPDGEEAEAEVLPF